MPVPQPPTHWFDQSGARVRLEWGAAGARELLATYAVVVDVLSFSTTMSVAIEQGSTVWPYAIPANGVEEFAKRHDAVVAVRRSVGRRSRKLSLSPSTWRRGVHRDRVVLPSGNGSTITHGLAARGATVVAGSLRNHSAVSAWLADRLAANPKATIMIIPAGERWPQGRGLRPCVEDLVGAGAVAAGLQESGLPLSPEAVAAAGAFRAHEADLQGMLRSCGSGRELIDRGYPEDVEIAAEIDHSTVVPVMRDGQFTP